MSMYIEIYSKYILESFTYYVIPCKYYKTLGKQLNGCKYLGITDEAKKRSLVITFQNR